MRCRASGSPIRPTATSSRGQRAAANKWLSIALVRSPSGTLVGPRGGIEALVAISVGVGAGTEVAMVEGMLVGMPNSSVATDGGEAATEAAGIAGRIIIRIAT